MINNIQILRAFAAINVVLFHIIGTSASYNQATHYLSRIEGWGASGVDLFFVISGFIMFYTQMRARKPVTEFLLHRAVRIVPLYWILTVFLVAISFVTPQIMRSGGALDPIWIVSSLFFLSGFVTSKMPVLYDGWTLEYEMAFYLIFGMVLFVKSWVKIGVITCIVMILISIIFRQYLFVEFVFGIIIAFFNQRHKLSSQAGISILLLGVLLLALSMGVGEKGGNMRVVLWGIPSFLIVLGSTQIAQLSSSLGILLGNASYSIYLIQVFTIPGFYKLSSRTIAGWNGDLVALVCLVLTVLIGILVHVIVERPITEWLRFFIGSKTESSRSTKLA